MRTKIAGVLAGGLACALLTLSGASPSDAVAPPASGAVATGVSATEVIPRCDSSTLRVQRRGPMFMWGTAGAGKHVWRRDAELMLFVDVLATCVADDWSVALTVGDQPRTFLRNSPYWNGMEFLGSGPYEAGDTLRFGVHWRWVPGHRHRAPATLSINGLSRDFTIQTWSDTRATWGGPTRTSVAPHTSLPSTITSQTGAGVNLPVSDWTPDQMRYAFFIRGTLVADGDCIRLREDRHGGALTTPIWPKGTTAVRAGDGITVYDASGRAVAATGDTVFYDGGYGEAPYPNACTRGEGSIFLVQDDL